MIARRRIVNLGAIACTLSLAGAALGAEGARIIGENRRTAQRFADASQMERDGRVSAALELYRSILAENSNDLAAFDSSGQQLLPARWLAHRRIANHAGLLEAFRNQVAGPAKKLLAEGIAARDRKLLGQLVETMFCARETESALHWLGDLACERGEFSTARQYWSRLVPGHADGALAFPGPAGDPALPAAKIVLSRLLAGESTGIAEEISRLESRYPRSEISMAGKKGSVGDVLRLLAAAPELAAPALPASYRPTDAANNARNGYFRRDFPFPLPTTSQASDSISIRNSITVQRPLLKVEGPTQFPVISQQHALVADARRIRAIEMSSERVVAEFDLRTLVESWPRMISENDARSTLSASGNTVYARLGQTRMRSDRIDSDSYIVALQFQPSVPEPLKLRWMLPATPPESADHAIFEGCPVILDDKLFVALTRFDGNRAVTEVACYDPAGSAPRLVWRQDILETGPEAANRSSQLLLCAADGLIVCGPYQGAIVALEASTGRRAWAFRYSQALAARSSSAKERWLEPCVAADSRLFAAPADSDVVMALNLVTGAPIWECGTLEVSSILGVAHGKVVCQTGGVVAGLRALDATTGRVLPNWGYAVHGSDAAAPLGRGLVFGDCVCWPTRADGIKILRLDGVPELTPAAFRSASCANIVFGSGHFVLATPNGLLVFATADSRQPGLDREAP